MNAETEARVRALRALFQHWLDWNVRQRESADLPVNDDVHVIAVPPHWPYRGSIKHWIETLDSVLGETVPTEPCKRCGGGSWLETIKCPNCDGDT